MNSRMFKNSKLARSIVYSVLAAGVLTYPAGNVSAGGIIVDSNEAETIIKENPVNIGLNYSNDIGGANRYAGIGVINNSSLDITAPEINIDFNGKGTESRIYGIALESGEHLNINGDVKIEGTVDSNTDFRGIRNNTGVLTINGAVDMDVTKGENSTNYFRAIDAWGSETVINGSTNFVLRNYGNNGSEVSAIGGNKGRNSQSNITLNGKENNLYIYSEAGIIIGVENNNTAGSKYTINGSFNFEAENGKNYSNKFNAVYAYQGTTEFNGDTSINIKNNSANGEVRAINAECNYGDKYETIINFNGETTKFDIDSKNYATVIFASGVPGKVNFTGKNVIVDVNAVESAVGMQSQEGAVINSSDSTNITIDAVSSEKSAYGIYVQNSSVEADEYNGNVNIGGNIAIKADGKTDSYGISNIAKENVQSAEDGNVVVKGDTFIEVVSHDGKAVGVYADGGYSKNDLLGNVSIKAEGSANSYAVLAEDEANISIGGEDKIIELIGTVAAESKGVVNLSGNAAESSTGVFSASGGGTVNFNTGSWVINNWQGADGNINVGENTTININNTITVADAVINGDVVIDTDKIKGAAIEAENKLELSKNANVILANVDAGEKITTSLFGGAAGSEELNKQAVSQMKTDNLMQNITTDEKGNIVIGVADASEVLPDVVLGGIVTGLTANNVHNGFFDDVLKSGDAGKAGLAINSVANMGELAGVNHGTYSMSNAMTDAVADHLSLAAHGEQDKDVWAHYIHNKENIDGMNLGGIKGSYDAQYNGIVVGSDLYKNGKTTAGIALSYADGNINGSNIASSTKNEAKYYGASLYGRIDNGSSALLGDISYLHSDNDITQTNSGHEITASADADAFSIGLRAEQAYKAGAGKIVPYAGIRYMHLGTGNYTNSLGMEYNADEQNLWLLPIGVTYSTEITSGGWTVKPIAEAGYVWTMGDRDTDQTVSLSGARDTFGFETADSGSFIGRLGIEAEKANVTYGLGYEYQKGDTVKANKWMANIAFSF